MKNLRNLLLIISIFLLVAVISIQFKSKTKEYSGIMEGIRIQLGNKEYKEDVKIKIDGKFKKRNYKSISFDGKILVNDKVMKCSEFDEYNMAMLSYEYEGYTKIYGQIYVSKELDEFTIVEGYWNSKDGTMIVLPAKSREEGLVVLNKSMGDFLKKNNTEILD